MNPDGYAISDCPTFSDSDDNRTSTYEWTGYRYPSSQSTILAKTHCYCCPLKQKCSVQKIDNHNQQTVLRHKLIQTRI